MLEVAIVSTKCALRDEVPEFMEYWLERGWEPKKAPEPEIIPEAKAEDAAKDSAEESAETVDATEENA